MDYSLKKIFKRSFDSWEKLYNEICNYYFETSNSAMTGLFFEEFAKVYLEEIEKFETVWLFDEIPLKVLDELQLYSQDRGVDLLLKDKNGKYWAVQCKFRINQNNTLYWSKDKLTNLFAAANKCDFYIIFTNAKNIDESTAHSHRGELQTYFVDKLRKISPKEMRIIYHKINNIEYDINELNEEEREEGKNNILWFILGILLEILFFTFVPYSFFLFINILIIISYGTKKLLNKLDNN